jgi:hypothetical protein
MDYTIFLNTQKSKEELEMHSHQEKKEDRVVDYEIECVSVWQKK